MKHRLVKRRRVPADVAGFVKLWLTLSVTIGVVVPLALLGGTKSPTVRTVQAAQVPPSVAPAPSVPPVTDSLIWRPARPAPVVDLEAVAFEQELDAAIDAVVTGKYRERESGRHHRYESDRDESRHRDHGDRDRHESTHRDRHDDGDRGRHHAEGGKHHAGPGRHHFRGHGGEGRHRAHDGHRGGHDGGHRGHGSSHGGGSHGHGGSHGGHGGGHHGGGGHGGHR